MTKHLTAKQATFVEEYLVDLNATQAAIRAGYSEKTSKQVGSENLSKPDIQEAIQAGMDKRSERTEIDADNVLTTIQKIVERCQEEDKFNPTAVLRGCELLGKHLKLFTDKIEHSGEIDLTSLTDEELDARLSALLGGRSPKEVLN